MSTMGVLIAGFSVGIFYIGPGTFVTLLLQGYVIDFSRKLFYEMFPVLPTAGRVIFIDFLNHNISIPMLAQKLQPGNDSGQAAPLFSLFLCPGLMI